MMKRIIESGKRKCKKKTTKKKRKIMEDTMNL